MLKLFNRKKKDNKKTPRNATFASRGAPDNSRFWWLCMRRQLLHPAAHRKTQGFGGCACAGSFCVLRCTGTKLKATADTVRNGSSGGFLRLRGAVRGRSSPVQRRFARDRRRRARSSAGSPGWRSRHGAGCRRCRRRTRRCPGQEE